LKEIRNLQPLWLFWMVSSLNPKRIRTIFDVQDNLKEEISKLKIHWNNVEFTIQENVELALIKTPIHKRVNRDLKYLDDFANQLQLLLEDFQKKEVSWKQVSDYLDDFLNNSKHAADINFMQLKLYQVLLDSVHKISDLESFNIASKCETIILLLDRITKVRKNPRYNIFASHDEIQQLAKMDSEQNRNNKRKNETVDDCPKRIKLK